MRGPRGRAARAGTGAAPRRDWLVAALAAAGGGVAGYLTATKLAGGRALFCTVGSGCDVVQASRYAVFLGLPTAAWGAALFVTIGGLALLGLDARRWLAAFLLAVAGASFSAYLTYIELAVLGAVCAYCVVSAAIVVALFGVLLARRPAPGGRRSPAQPGRVAVLGSITAAATIAITATIFAAGAPGARAAYQEALARHLAASGAVMYGAYW